MQESLQRWICVWWIQHNDLRSSQEQPGAFIAPCLL